MRNVIFRQSEDGSWWVDCPSLPGCISQGDTREEAMANISATIDEYIEVLEDQGIPVPEDVAEDEE